MGIFDIDDNINNIDKNIIEHVLTLQLSGYIAKEINEEILNEIKQIINISDDNNKV